MIHQCVYGILIGILCVNSFLINKLSIKSSIEEHIHKEYVNDPKQVFVGQMNRTVY